MTLREFTKRMRPLLQRVLADTFSEADLLLPHWLQYWKAGSTPEEAVRHEYPHL